jgi:magnesium transporter
MSSGNTMRRRGTGISSIGGNNYPNYLPSATTEVYEDTLPTHPLGNSRGSIHGSFLSEKVSLEDWNKEEVEDVKTDVLYPRYNASKDDHVDIAAFNKMLQDHTRKLSTGTLPLSRTLSRQNQLYGSSKYGDLNSNNISGIRFRIYSAQKNSNISARLEQLLTEQGQEALESVVKSKGWWVDVSSPSPEEMRVLSKVKHYNYLADIHI